MHKQGAFTIIENMFNTFFPDKYYDSTYHIDFDALYRDGYRGIIFDIDNTLVPHGAPADARSRELIAHLKDIGFSILFLSNNKEPRVKMFNDEVDCLYLYKANKPSRKGYYHAMALMNTNHSNTLTVGDQLFTDIWGAKRTGILSILVKQIDKKEEIQIVLKRILEKVILKRFESFCKKNGKVYLYEGR